MLRKYILGIALVLCAAAIAMLSINFKSPSEAPDIDSAPIVIPENQFGQPSPTPTNSIDSQPEEQKTASPAASENTTPAVQEEPASDETAPAAEPAAEEAAPAIEPAQEVVPPHQEAAPAAPAEVQLPQAPAPAQPLPVAPEVVYQDTPVTPAHIPYNDDYDDYDDDDYEVDTDNEADDFDDD